MNSALVFNVRLGIGLALLLVVACARDDAPPSQNSGAAVISAPARLAEVDAETFLVTDYYTGAVHLVDKSTLQPRKSLHLSGQATGVALLNGRYFVGNKATRSVDVLDNQGQLLYHLGGHTGEFSSVNDLAVDPDVAAGIVYVLDTKSALVRIFSVDGTDTGTSIGAGTLKQPTALTLDPDSGNLLVSDFGDPSTSVPPAILIFSPSGVQLDVIAGGKTRFSTPQGLFVDGGYVFLVDALAGEVQMFRLADKTRVKVIGSLGTGEGELRYPLDVIIDAITKDVFVADNGNRRITVYRAGGAPP